MLRSNIHDSSFLEAMHQTVRNLVLAVDTNAWTARLAYFPRGVAALALAAMLVLAGGTWAWLGDGGGGARAVPREPDRFFSGSFGGTVHRGFDFYEGLSPRPMPVCVGGERENCIVDGGGFWLNGMHFRIANVDAPRLDGRCLTETARAREARATLQQLLDNQPIDIHGKGRDAFNRIRAVIRTPKGDVGARLVRFNVAATWKGRPEPVGTWCGD